ncbi:MAG: acyltransferase family protein, partial [Acidobacteriota bacterium]
FSTRRISRLLPALTLSVRVSATLICLFNPFAGISIKTGMAALGGLSNLYLWRVSRDYFAPASELNIFTNTWSLGVEEQFYLIYPILFWLVGRRSRRQLAGLIGLLSIASLLLYLWLSYRHRALAFFLMPARFWELGAGVLTYLERGRIGRLLAGLSPLALGLALVVILIFPLPAVEWGTIGCVLLTGLLIGRLVAPQPRPSVIHDLLRDRRIVYLGLLSYSLYLWHWTVLTLARWTTGVDARTAPWLMLLILGLAMLSYHLVERPLRQRAWSTRRWGTVLLGLGGLIGAVSLLAILQVTGDRLYLGKEGGTEAGRRESQILSQPGRQDILGRSREWERDCNMTPHLLSGAAYRPPPRVDEKFISRCLATDSAARRLILVGDSFASVSAPHLAAVSREAGLDFRVIYGFGCPYPIRLAEIRPEPGLRCTEIDEEWFRRVLIATLREGDILALRLYLPRYLRLTEWRLPAPDVYDQALIRLRDEVRSKGASLLIIGANPTPTIAQIRSLDRQWFNFRDSSAARLTEIAPRDNLETASFHQLDDHLRARFRAEAGLVFFSVKPWLCRAGDLCPMMAEGQPLYDHDPHLTPAAHDRFFAALAQVVGEMASRGRPMPAP